MTCKLGRSIVKKSSPSAFKTVTDILHNGWTISHREDRQSIMIGMATRSRPSFPCNRLRHHQTFSKVWGTIYAVIALSRAARKLRREAPSVVQRLGLVDTWSTLWLFQAMGELQQILGSWACSSTASKAVRGSFIRYLRVSFCRLNPVLCFLLLLFVLDRSYHIYPTILPANQFSNKAVSLFFIGTAQNRSGFSTSETTHHSIFQS